MPKVPNKAEARQKIIDHLVGNCDCETDAQFAEEDREVLNKFSNEQLERLYKEDHEEKPAPTGNKQKEPAPKKEEPVANKEEPTPKQFDEAQLPDNVKEELAFARNMMQQQKDQFVAKITANESCLYTKEELATKSLDDLTKIASLVDNKDKEETPQDTTRLGGHAAPTGNKAKKYTSEDVLDLPVMNFGSDK